MAAVAAASIAAGSNNLAPFWGQWGQNPQHTGTVTVAGQTGSKILADVVYDPFTSKEEQGPYATGDLLAHFQTPLVAGNDVFMEYKTGQYSNIKNWQVQTWGEEKLTWQNGSLVLNWQFESDWKPVPFAALTDKDGPGWEPVFHGVLTKAAIYVPGVSGSVWKLDRDTGSVLSHITPFQPLDSNIYAVGPLSADSGGNIYYNVMKLNGAVKDPWLVDVPNSWLIKIDTRDQFKAVPWATLVPGTPAAGDQCKFRFDLTDLPWPPSPDAVVPTIACGSQRPPVNTAPAIAPDGTIYDISRASLNDYYGYLVAIRPDLTPKWVASMREKFTDGCGTSTLPPNGQPGGCRAGAHTGISPPDNLPGSGRVLDDSTSAPVVAPDGSVYYGAYTRYNYAQGHLMRWSGAGVYLPSNTDARSGFQFGWDTTPALFPYTAADGTATFALITKENHYSETGSYCNDDTICPPDRNANNPGYPEQYFMTSLSPDLSTINWRWQNTNPLSCGHAKDGSVTCVSDHPAGFEWCVNAPAVDKNGTVFSNSEDGNLYEIDRNGKLVNAVFTNLAVGAAYTPISIGPDGKIYTQNNGHLFVVGD
jgi:hypothetical protein